MQTTKKIRQIAKGASFNVVVESITSSPYTIHSDDIGKAFLLEAGSSIINFNSNIKKGFSCILINKEAEAKSITCTNGTVTNANSHSGNRAADGACVTVIFTADGSLVFSGDTE